MVYAATYVDFLDNVAYKDVKMSSHCPAIWQKCNVKKKHV